MASAGATTTGSADLEMLEADSLPRGMRRASIGAGRPFGRQGFRANSSRPASSRVVARCSKIARIPVGARRADADPSMASLLPHRVPRSVTSALARPESRLARDAG